MYNRGGPQGMRPPFNRSGVRMVAPYVEFPPENEEVEGERQYYEGVYPENEVYNQVHAPIYPSDDAYYPGEPEMPGEPDQSMTTTLQQIREYMSSNQTKLTELGDQAQQVSDKQDQRMTKMEESLNAQGAKISAMRNLPSDSDESPTDPKEPTSLNIYTVASNILS
ncbi:MAG: hypothetical protein GY820_43235, partial [Gammaproteobacteria bacterium]|nr:hypothetical protein [Gammaproteobacteria bacterium]